MVVLGKCEEQVCPSTTLPQLSSIKTKNKQTSIILLKAVIVKLMVLMFWESVKTLFAPSCFC